MSTLLERPRIYFQSGWVGSISWDVFMQMSSRIPTAPPAFIPDLGKPTAHKSPGTVLSGPLALPSLSQHRRVPYCFPVAWGSYSSKMFCEALPASSSLGQPFSVQTPLSLGTFLRKHMVELLLGRSHLRLPCSGKQKTKASCESRPLIAPSPLTLSESRS